MPRERDPQSPRSLEREASLGVHAQRELGLADVVGRLVPPLGERHLAGHHVPAEPPERISPPAVPHGRDGLAGEHPAVAAPAADRGADRLQHGHPGSEAGVGARPVRPPGQLLHQIDETLPVDEHVAPGEVEHGAQIGAGHVGGYGGDRPAHHPLPAVVVEVGVLGGHEPERVAWPVGQQPVLQREDRLAGVLVPPGGASVPLGRAGRAPSPPPRPPARHARAHGARTTPARGGGSRTGPGPPPGGGGHARSGDRSGHGRDPG